MKCKRVAHGAHGGTWSTWRHMEHMAHGCTWPSNLHMKAYIAWQDNEVSSSSSSLEDAEVNLCLKAKEEHKSHTVSSNSSINVEKYS